MNVEVQATVAFQVTVSFQLTAKLPFTVAPFNEVFQVVVKLFSVVFQLTHKLDALTSPAVIAHVKEDCPFTANHSVVMLSEVRAVMLQFVASKLVIVASVEVNVAIFQEVAVKSQATDKSDCAVTSQVNVEVSFTVKVSVVNEVAVAVHKSEAVAVKLSIVAESASIAVALTLVALTVVQVNSHSAVILPVKVIFQFTVSNVTLDKSNCMFSIAFSNAVISRETL